MLRTWCAIALAGAMALSGDGLDAQEADASPTSSIAEHGAIDPAAEGRAREVVEEWQARLARLEDAIRRGVAPDDSAQELLTEMKQLIATGHEELVARVIRVAALLYAAADKKSGGFSRECAVNGAVTYFHLARQLWSEIDTSTEQFGEPAAVLAERWHVCKIEIEKLRERAAEARVKEDYVPPTRQGSMRLEYPVPARTAGLEAVVRVSYLIDDGGLPLAPVVTDPGIPSSLRLEALATVLASRFEPATVDGVPMPAEAEVALRFEEPR